MGKKISKEADENKIWFRFLFCFLVFVHPMTYICTVQANLNIWIRWKSQNDVLKCRKVEVEFIITIFPQHIPALLLLWAVSPSVVCAGWSLLKISDNQERSRRDRPGFRIVINSDWFLFQPPEPSSVSHHSHCSLHLRSFLTPSETQPGFSSEAVLLFTSPVHMHQSELL